MAISAEPNETVTNDAFLGGALSLFQPRKAYRAGIDSVLLAAAVPARAGARERILDAGSGVGVVGLCIARRVPDVDVTLVEIQPSLAELAAQNIMQNALESRVSIIAADVARGGAAFEDDGLAPRLIAGSFAHVAANPPYFASGQGSSSPDARKALAHEMPQASLDAWCRFLATACSHGGTATMIHRASALADVLAALGPRFGALRVLPIHPRDGQPANRIIVQGVKGSRGPMTLLSGLVLHDESGHGYVARVDAVLRTGAALSLA